MRIESRDQALWWTLRVGAGLCFIGHGAFGIITKPEWMPFFGVVGIPRETAFALMPMIGVVDITLGLMALLRPARGVFLYMALWALWTAALRPLSGDSAFEMLERAGNYGVPFACLLLLAPMRSWRDLVSRATPSLSREREALVRRVLVATTALLLVGHGGLAAVERKDLLVQHAGLLGFGESTVVAAGSVELALAVLILFFPRPWLLVGVAGWKIASEMLYPASGAPVWEFIERAGSYAAPFALALLLVGRETWKRRRIVGPISGVGFAAAALIISATTPAAAQSPTQGSSVVDSLRSGGFVLACRHAATDHNQSDNGRARDQQRNLTPKGEQQAKAMGEAIRALKIQIGEVRANPMYRSQETATHAFGSSAIVDSTLSGSGASSALRAMLKAAVPPGTNRVIVARIGILTGAMEDHGVRDMDEGTCVVVRPIDGSDYRIIGRIGIEEWTTFVK